jgi:hypothetical protein
MNKLWIPLFAAFSLFHTMNFATITITQWVDPKDDIPGLQENVEIEESYERPIAYDPNAARAPARINSARQNWQNDRFAEEQFQDTGWPGRRGDELSDQLSR